MVSDITDRLLPQIEDWQKRPLDAVYPIVFIDAVHFSVRDNGQIRKLAAYVILAVSLTGHKEVLSIHIGENESAKYWLGVLNELKNRGVKDILVICADGLTGMKEAVNAANDRLMGGSGVCGAIFKAACDAIGHCDTGSAVITPGFDMKAKYIIHAVGPIWHGGDHKEPQLLYGAYRRSLELAAENGCHSIGFPLISAGIYGYPIDKAWRKAIQACCNFFGKHPDADISVVFAVLDRNILDLGKDTLEELAPQYVIVTKNDWKTCDMPTTHDSFVFKRPFSDKQMQTLRKGHIPQEMEDKWFWYMEGDRLFAHRSWTGFCVYVVEFSPDGSHKVTVNRDPEQYGCTDVNEDILTLNKLFDWWTGEPYDYYNEWLSEIVDAIKKAEKP